MLCGPSAIGGGWLAHRFPTVGLAGWFCASEGHCCLHDCWDCSLFRQRLVSLVGFVPVRGTVGRGIVGIAGFPRQRSLLLVGLVPVRGTVRRRGGGSTTRRMRGFPVCIGPRRYATGARGRRNEVSARRSDGVLSEKPRTEPPSRFRVSSGGCGAWHFAAPHHTPRRTPRRAAKDRARPIVRPRRLRRRGRRYACRLRTARARRGV